jgi:hypothetical protein
VLKVGVGLESWNDDEAVLLFCIREDAVVLMTGSLVWRIDIFVMCWRRGVGSID